jgi:hypothetical protein
MAGGCLKAFGVEWVVVTAGIDGEGDPVRDAGVPPGVDRTELVETR